MNRPSRGETPPPTPSTAVKGFDVFIICWIVMAVVLGSDPLWRSWAGKGIHLGKETLLLLLVLGYFAWRGIPPVATMRWKPTRGLNRRALLTAAVTGAVLFDGFDRLIGLVMPIPPDELQLLEDSITINGFGEGFLLLLGVVVAAPLVEESIFRGAIQQAFERRRDPTAAVLLTSFIFALLHLQPQWMIQLLVLAVLLGYVAWQFDSILPGIALHAFVNGWSLILANISGRGFFMKLYLWHGQLNPLIAVVCVLSFIQAMKRLAAGEHG